MGRYSSFIRGNVINLPQKCAERGSRTRGRLHVVWPYSWTSLWSPRSSHLNKLHKMKKIVIINCNNIVHDRHILSRRFGHRIFLRPFLLFRWFKLRSPDMTSAVYRGSVYLFCLIYVPLVGWPTYYHGKQLRSCLDYNTRCIARKTCFRGFRPGLWYTPTHTGLCSHNRCPNKGLKFRV